MPFHKKAPAYRRRRGLAAAKMARNGYGCALHATGADAMSLPTTDSTLACICYGPLPKHFAVNSGGSPSSRRGVPSGPNVRWMV